MLNYISHRLMIMVPTLLAISAIVFIIKIGRAHV